MQLHAERHVGLYEEWGSQAGLRAELQGKIYPKWPKICKLCRGHIPSDTEVKRNSIFFRTAVAKIKPIMQKYVHCAL